MMKLWKIILVAVAIVVPVFSQDASILGDAVAQQMRQQPDALLAREGRQPLKFFSEEEVFPHIAVGGPWSTDLTFVNVGTGPAEFSLRFFTPSGQPWTVTTSGGIQASTFTVRVPLFESFTISLPSRGTLIQTGWAEIDQPANTTIGGHAVFRDSGGPGRPIPFEAVVPLSTFAEGSEDLLDGFRITFLPYDQTQGFNTCFAVANSSAFSTTTFTVLAVADGEITVLMDDIPLPPRNQMSGCFRDELPVLNNRKGVVMISRPSSDLTLSSLGFRFDPQGAFTTLFPMSEL